MGYEHPNATSKMESDEIIKPGAEELVPILSENEVSLEDKRECDMPICENSPICDDHSEIFFDSNNDDDISSDDDDFEDIEFVEASLFDPEIVTKFKPHTIQYSKPKNPNELFQKLLEDLKELADDDNPPSRNRSHFLNEDHSDQNKESLENSSTEIAVLNSNQEKEGQSQDSDIRHLIREECCVEANLIKSALNTKLLLINSQRLDKKEQEVTNVIEQPAERRNLAPILSTKETEHPPSMGYEHPNATSKMESDEIIKPGAEELVPILSENEVSLEDKRECDMPICENSPICDDHSEIFFDSNNDDDISSDDDDFEDIEDCQFRRGE
nr:hypothetical protein [Tanacetum cinerariifolium]